MRLIERRIGFLFAVFLVLLVLGGVRAAWLGVVKAGTLKQAAVTQQEADITVPARRGTILDREGTELAVSQPAVTIAATPYLVEDAPAVAARLSRVLREPEDELLRQLARRDTGFAYLARHVKPSRARRVQRMEIAGLEFIPEFERVYPRDWMASQLLGVTGTDGNGLAGLEYSLDEHLGGRDGERRLTKDALGDAIELREVRKTVPGADIRLTLDANVQDRAEEVLAEVGEEWKPKGATAIVMDPRDGAILALANWPRVNANALGDAPDYARQNRAIGATYEPGSTFKAFTVAGALEEGEVAPEHELQRAAHDHRRRPRDRRGARRSATARSPRARSSRSPPTSGSVMIGQRLGAERFDSWIRRFGFGSPTGIDLPGEEQGILLDLDKYSGSSMGNLPIGQGLAVTPMQMAVGYSAIANGGILRAPHIVERVGARAARKPEGHRVISEATAASVRRMLEGVLGPGGTASGAQIEGYVLGGKTGTAEKPDEYGGYSKTKFVSSFVGFAPAKRPKLLVAVMVDEPQGDIYGGTVAAPAFQRITSFALNYLRISPD